jgi:hypothetical protein
MYFSLILPFTIQVGISNSFVTTFVSTERLWLDTTALNSLIISLEKFNEILPAFASSAEWHLADWRQVVDNLAQHFQLFSDGGQFLRVCGQVVAVTPSGFSTARNCIWKLYSMKSPRY